MAKWGEGDPRWLVEERTDGTNVNNWHWVEKNATPWSENRLKELLIGKTLESEPITIKFVEFSKIEGEATANNRKAKLIFLFEWALEIKVTASVTGSDINYEGVVEIPNLSDENEADEVDINVDMKTKGPDTDDIRLILNREGLAFIRKQAGVYISELKQKFADTLILPTEMKKP